MKIRTTVLILVLVGLLVPGLVVACGGAQEEAPVSPSTEEAAGELSGDQLLQARCTRCHGLDRVEAGNKTQAEWESTVERMRGNGADLTDPEAKVLVEYLAETYGP